MQSRYRQVYADWRRDPQGFWRDAARAVDWIRPPERMFDADAGPYGRWFPEASLNICFNALDRHVLGGRRDQAALIYDSPLLGTLQRWTYGELLEEVRVLAAVLRASGCGEGRSRDRLHADDPASRDGDARLRPDRRRAFRGVRRLSRRPNWQNASTTRSRSSS